MAYFAATALNEKNSDLSEIAIVSALGDRQDQGDKKSFTGKNFEIANTAKELGLVVAGDMVVISAGSIEGKGNTDLMKVRVVK